MFVMANLIHALTVILELLLNLMLWVIIIRVILSWANADPMNGLVRVVTALTEPVLKPFRRMLPPYKTGGWDLSPLFACIAIIFLQNFLVPTLRQLAGRLG
jgi:YggT family protein